MKTIKTILSYTLLALLPLCSLQAMDPPSSKQLDDLLVRACVRGFREPADNLIRLGAHINQKEAAAGSPLMIAAHYGHTELVKFLLSKGADANGESHGLNALACAISGTKHLKANKSMPHDRAEEVMLEIVEELIKAGIKVNFCDHDNMTALHQAALCGTARIAQRLIKAGAKVNIQTKKLGLTPLMGAASAGHLDTIKVLLKAGASLDPVSTSGKTALYGARCRGHKDIAHLLEQVSKHGVENVLGKQDPHYFAPISSSTAPSQEPEGASDIPSSSDFTRRISKHEQQFFQAVHDGNKQAVKKVLTQVNINAQDKKGHTALYLAVKNNHFALVKFLLKVGASLEMSTYQRNITPLMKALKKGHEKIALFLIDEGAQVTAVDTYGKTTLQCAATGECEKAISLLIKMGLNVNTTTMNGISALVCATGNNRVSIISRLVAAGAQLDIKHTLTQAFAQNTETLSNEVEKLFVSKADSIHLKKTILSDFSQAKNSLFKQMNREALEFINMLNNPHIQAYLKDPYYSSLASTVYAECFNQTVLIWACALGHSEVVETVLGKVYSKEFVHAQDTYGRNALMYAIMCSYDTITSSLLSVIPYLPEHLNVRDKKGNTALMYAAAKGNFTIARRLIKAGALFTPGDSELVIKLATKPEIQKQLNSLLALCKLHMLYNVENTHS